MQPKIFPGIPRSVFYNIAIILNISDGLMDKKRFKVVGLGEVLFDLLPNGKVLGGTVSNFAYVSNQLGNQGIIASRVGKDDLGNEALQFLHEAGLDTSYIQIDSEHPTGTVDVTLIDGQPSYNVIEGVAWDFLGLTDQWQELAKTCDAVCFGTLGQRNAVSEKTIQGFLAATREGCLKVFDINFRQHFYSKENVATSLKWADVVKLNHEELPVACEMFGIECSDQIAQARQLLEKYGLKVICITRGGNGSVLLNADDVSEHPGIKVQVADTIGAGDSFTATMAHGLLRNWDLDEINNKANQVAAFVASKTGAMPSFKDFKFS